MPGQAQDLNTGLNTDLNTDLTTNWGPKPSTGCWLCLRMRTEWRIGWPRPPELKTITSQEQRWGKQAPSGGEGPGWGDVIRFALT